MKLDKLLLVIVLSFILTFCEKEVSVSPPDQPPPNGSIKINSYPDEFKIFINGKYRIRNTPDSLRWLENGVYEVLLRKNLFLDTVFTAEVRNEGQTEIFIDFSKNDKMLGNLFVTSKPEGADIFIDDSTTGKRTPFQFKKILPDIYNVSLSYKDHEGLNSQVEVRSSKVSELNVVMVDTTLWDYYNIQNSEIQAEVLTVLQIDSLDVVWIGSREGVISFKDNYWNLQSTSNSSLPHNVVTDIEVDSKNSKWITTNEGIGIANGMVVNEKWGSKEGGFGTDYFTNVFILKNKSDTYVVASDIGLYSYGLNPQTGFYMWSYDPLITQGPFTSVWINSEAIFVGTASSGVIASIDGWVVFNRLNSNIPGNSISAMYENEEGIWIGHLPGSGNSGGLSLYKNGQFTVYNLTLPAPNIYSIYVDSDNIKWVGTDKGIFTFTDFSNKILIDKNNSGLPIKDVIGIDEDSKGNIWFATKENGVFKLKNKEKIYNTY